MGLVMYHVSDRANRDSIQRHGLDWRRMRTAPGIAGNRVPEHGGIFLAENLDEAKYFIEMGESGGRHNLDVWEVCLDLDVDLSGDDAPSLPPGIPLVLHADGYLCYLQPIPPKHLKLIDPETLPDE